MNSHDPKDFSLISNLTAFLIIGVLVIIIGLLGIIIVNRLFE